MKILKHALLSLSLVALFASPAFAQKNIKEGQITFDISYNDLPDEMKGFESMLPKEMNMFFNKDFVRVEMPTGMGSSVTISNKESGEVSTLVDMMGSKYVMNLNQEEQKEMADEANPEVNIEYIDEEKEIAGYKCKKAQISVDENEMEVWYTEEIDVKGSISPNMPDSFEQLDGFPMEYSINTGQFTMVMSVAKVDKKGIDKKMFEIPAGYKEVTPEEFQKMFGGGM